MISVIYMFLTTRYKCPVEQTVILMDIHKIGVWSVGILLTKVKLTRLNTGGALTNLISIYVCMYSCFALNHICFELRLLLFLLKK